MLSVSTALVSRQSGHLTEVKTILKITHRDHGKGDCYPLIKVACLMQVSFTVIKGNNFQDLRKRPLYKG